MPVLLDTEELSAADRADAFREALTRATGAHELRFLGPPDQFHARLDYWHLDPAVSVLHQTSSGVSHRRTERQSRHDGPARVVFVLHGGGPGTYVHDETASPLRRGDLAVTDLNAPYAYVRPGEGTVHVLQVDRSALGLTVEELHAGSVRLPSSPFYNLLRSHVADLCAAAPHLGAGDRGAVAGLTAHLAGELLRCAVEPDRPRSGGAPSEYVIRQTVLFLRANFHDPEITGEDVARGLGVSTRYLFQQWSKQPRSLAETLSQMRMDAARELLLTGPRLPVGVVAHRCGFANVAHFARRFRAENGVTASDYREGAPAARLASSPPGTAPGALSSSPLEGRRPPGPERPRA